VPGVLGRTARAVAAVACAVLGAPRAVAQAGAPAGEARGGPARPNILWIVADDMGPQLGSYGERLARTPNLDRLAREGVRYTHAYTTAPICSPSRSALATGMYQTTIGAHQHRTVPRAPLPPGVRPVTHLLREAGYFTVNVRPPRPGPTPGAAGNGKTDYNFTADSLFDGSDWRERRPGQPFFAQLTIFETHKGAGWPLARRQRELVDPRAVALPPYYPDHPVVRDEVANYLDAVHLLDGFVGDVLARLAREGLAENTLVFFFADNGRPLVRSKQWLYDGGVHVPLVVRWPGVLAPGAVDDRLVSGIDIPATTLRAAGVGLPPGMQGRPFLGPGAVRREYVVTARDRADVATDRIRGVRTARWSYMRNYYPMIPYMQVNPYMEREYPTWTLLARLGAAGRLDDVQRRFLADRKPVEELYDVQADPHEVRNLAGSPAQDSVLRALRAVLDRWVVDTKDRGGEGEDPLAVFRAHFDATDVGAVPAARREGARRVYFGRAAPDAPAAGAAPGATTRSP
jgi:arylsulfatase A-like enzyme